LRALKAIVFFFLIFCTSSLPQEEIKNQSQIKEKISSEKKIIQFLIEKNLPLDEPAIIRGIVQDYYLFKNNGEIDSIKEILLKAYKEVDWKNIEKHEANIGNFFTVLGDYYYQKKDLNSAEKIFNEGLNILNTSKKTPIIKASYARLLIIKTGFLIGPSQDVLNRFVKGEWKLFNDYAEEFENLSDQEKKIIISIYPEYLSNAYYMISLMDSLLNFTGKRPEYSFKALKEIDKNPKIDKSSKINIYVHLLSAAIFSNDEVLLKEALFNIKKFTIAAKENPENLVAIQKSFSLLFKLYQIKNLDVEANDLLDLYSQNFIVKNPSELDPGNLGKLYSYYYAKSEIERKKHNYKMSLYYLNKIISIKEYDIEEVIKLNGKYEFLYQKDVIYALVPNICDLYFRLGMTSEIRKMSKILTKVEIEEITLNELKNVENYYNPQRILNPLFSYYVQTNNIEKAKMVAEYIDKNFSKIFRLNYVVELNDLTRNSKDYYQLGYNDLVNKISDYTQSFVLNSYNDSIYQSVWKPTTNNVNATIDFFEVSNLIKSKEFFEKNFLTAQIIKNSNNSRDIMKSYLNKKLNNPIISEYQKLKTEIIALEKNDIFKLSNLKSQSEFDITEAVILNSYTDKIKKLSELESEIKVQQPDYFKLMKISGVKLSEIQDKLNVNEAILDYYFGEDKFAVIIIKKNSYNVFISKTSYNELNLLKNRVRKTLTGSSSGIPPYDLKDAFQLNKILFLSIKDQLKNIKKIYIVPDGPLNEIPIYALPKKDGKTCLNDCNKVDWNLNDYTFSYLSSYENFIFSDVDSDIKKIFNETKQQTFRILNNIIFESKDTSSVNQITYLGIGDPDLYSENKENKNKLDYERFLRSVGSDKIIKASEIKANYKPLPNTKEEIINAAAIFGNNSTILLRENATVSNFKNLDLTKYNVIHFATHGEISGVIKGINEPFLVLSPPKEFAKNDNGILMMNDIMQLNTKADIVILSACNTGSTEDTYSGSYSGLAKAFFVSGSKSVLVSNWYIETVSAQKLISNFIKNFSSNNFGYAENLKLSMQEISKENNYNSHPIFWAPFVFVGSDRKIGENLH
jgi:CHAT domain-containing protein